MLRAFFGDTDEGGRTFIMCYNFCLPSSDEVLLAKKIIATEKQNIVTNQSFTVFVLGHFVPMQWVV
jgi:hypothetical protein